MSTHSKAFVGLLIAAAILFFPIIIGLVEDNNTKSNSVAASSAQTISTQTPTTPHDYLTDRWLYREIQDQMTGKTIKHACIKSLNTVNFNFPYNGEQRATLSLYVHPRWGKSVTLELEKGQFFMGNFVNTKAIARFDNGPPISFQVSNSADADNRIIFLKGFQKFLTNLRKSNRVAIEVVCYNEGVRIFEFKTEGINDWSF